MTGTLLVLSASTSRFYCWAHWFSMLLLEPTWIISTAGGLFLRSPCRVCCSVSSISGTPQSPTGELLQKQFTVRPEVDGNITHSYWPVTGDDDRLIDDPHTLCRWRLRAWSCSMWKTWLTLILGETSTLINKQTNTHTHLVRSSEHRSWDSSQTWSQQPQCLRCPSPQQQAARLSSQMRMEQMERWQPASLSSSSDFYWPLQAKLSDIELLLKPPTWPPAVWCTKWPVCVCVCLHTFGFIFVLQLLHL